MSMADAENLQARKPHADHSGESVSVPMLNVEDQYPNPFQQRPQPNQHHSQQRHYNVMIPAVEHWPGLFLQGVRTAAQFSSEKLRQFQEARAKGQYQGLPMTSISSSASSSSRPTTFSFGSKRQLKDSGGRTMLCSGRRLTRILLLLTVLVTIPLYIFVIPRTLKPFQNRDVWVRYFNHEEPIKIDLPYAKRVHVADVKKVAFHQLSQGYQYSGLELGQMFLISPYGRLKPDEEWENDEYRFESSFDQPILVVDPREQLFEFLSKRLQCFSDSSYYYGGGRFGHQDIVFKPPSNTYYDYSNLWYILRNIREANNPDRHNWYNSQHTPVSGDYIQYLRKGFNDPMKNEYVPDGKFFYKQERDDRQNANDFWNRPRYTGGSHFNDTIDPIWWGEPETSANIPNVAIPEKPRSRWEK
ncbi:hypothetical protein BGZ83_000900 [Gryganskiella cystojenkinii]|nr:hypothetical protein BGZ83_000900 [Gryganskiella cystojenkinii]